MNSVFLLEHVHEVPGGEEDVKLIGVYRSEAAARAAVARVGSAPGFVDDPDGFHIDEYELDKDHWVEGFVTVFPGE